MKRVLILGSTGTIGINALKVIDQFRDRFQVVGLSAYNNVDVLCEQIGKFQPKHVCIQEDKREALAQRVGGDVQIGNISDDLAGLCSLEEVDIVVIGISGRAALEPFLAAARSGKMIAPANKEALVIAGDILMQVVKANGAKIIPVDSEQSAIFQCLEGHNRKDVQKVYLTASGGTLRDVPEEEFDRLTSDDILNHPRWKMGAKITVDSATMMNKGFEIIEAQRLFDLSVDEIEVVVHPEAIVHSMVCFCDGSIIAQLGVTDMRIPIQYALTYPERWPSSLAKLDLFQLGQLNFERPDDEKFPSLTLAIQAARQGGTVPAVLNAANEVAVEAFLKRQISFTDIYIIVERTVKKHQKCEADTIATILEADRWARQVAGEDVKRIYTEEN